MKEKERVIVIFTPGRIISLSIIIIVILIAVFIYSDMQQADWTNITEVWN